MVSCCSSGASKPLNSKSFLKCIPIYFYVPFSKWTCFIVFFRHSVIYELFTKSIYSCIWQRYRDTRQGFCQLLVSRFSLAVGWSTQIVEDTWLVIHRHLLGWVFLLLLIRIIRWEILSVSGYDPQFRPDFRASGTIMFCFGVFGLFRSEYFDQLRCQITIWNNLRIAVSTGFDEPGMPRSCYQGLCVTLSIVSGDLVVLVNLTTTMLSNMDDMDWKIS